MCVWGGGVDVSSAKVRCVCDKLNLTAKSLVNTKGFQNANFAKMLSLPSYSLFPLSHGQGGHFQSLNNYATWQVQLTTITNDR